MLSEMTAKQFREWQAYAELEPWDEVRQDYRFAALMCLLANLHRGKKQKAYELKDFLLQFGGEQKPKQTWQMQQAIAYAIVAAYSQPAAKK